MILRRTRSRRSPPKGRFFFIHIQKTGGTALLAQFREAFPAQAIYPNQTDGHPMLDGPQFRTELLERAWRTRGHQLRMVIGHFPYCTVESLPVRFQTMTLLRDPVERTLSFLRHHRQLHPDDRDRTLADLYGDQERFGPMIHNHMVMMLGMRAEEMDDGMLTRLAVDRGHLDRAKVNLRSIDVIGVQEDFDGFRRQINRRFGFSIQQAERVNTSDTVPDEDDTALLARIHRDNALDCELYDYAVELLGQQSSS